MKKFILSALLPLVYFLYLLVPLPATLLASPPPNATASLLTSHSPVANAPLVASATISHSDSKCNSPALSTSDFQLSPLQQSVAYSNPTPLASDTLKTPTIGSYACILSEESFFYAAPSENTGLFLLPKTYYVKLLAYAPDFCQVEYLYDDTHVKKLIGYARTNELTFVDYIPEKPYLYYLFEISYRLEEANGQDEGFLTEIKATCAYYGDYKIGSNLYCYVLRGDSFGYVPKPATIRYEENGEYAQRHLQADEPPTVDEHNLDEPSSSPAQIAILIALCLLVPIVAALILKPPRRPPYETDE